jgi:hypothetical protein
MQVGEKVVRVEASSRCSPDRLTLRRAEVDVCVGGWGGVGGGRFRATEREQGTPWRTTKCDVRMPILKHEDQICSIERVA